MTHTTDFMARLHGLCFTTPRPWSAAEIAQILANPHCFALNSPHGFLLGQSVAGDAELLTLAVDPNQRRHGIGRALVAQFCDVARQKAAQTAFLEVAANNAAAIALYQSCGFTQSGLRRAYYNSPDGTSIDALVMACVL
jgi:ribosomal-protein-alanine N-acetyltransferase